MLGLRRSHAACVALVLTAVIPSRANAQQCKTDSGPFQANLQPPPACTSPIGLCSLGTLGGKSPETYYFVMDTLLPFPDPTQPSLTNVYTGHSVITRVRGGAELFGQDSGTLVFNPTDGTGSFVTTVNVVGGTKQYANATGQFVATGQIDFVTGAIIGTFTSSVCK